MRSLTWDADYGRNGLAYIKKGDCPHCSAKEVPLLVVDGSEGEYAEFEACIDCIYSLFEK